jgi:dihydroorotate dehydrogenase subfamily 1
MERIRDAIPNTKTGGRMKKKKKFFETAVLSSRETERGSGIYRLMLYAEKQKPAIGQFYEIAPDSSSPMPRPFSVADYADNTLTFYIKAIGKNTNKFCELESGDTVKLIGPLGKPFKLRPSWKKVILVGGGTGIATLMPIAKERGKKGEETLALLGGRDESQILCQWHFKRQNCVLRYICQTEQCERNLVTHLLEDALKNDGGKSIVIACGPRPMLKRVAEICKNHTNECYVSLEAIMACGIGSCKGCDIPTTKKDENGNQVYTSVCSEGPFFNALDIDWAKLIPPLITIESRKKATTTKIDPLQTDLWGYSRNLLLKYPIMTAAGCYTLESVNDGPVNEYGIGAHILKSLCVDMRQGNPEPRVCETPSGMLNSIGLKGMGLKEFLSISPMILDMIEKTGRKIVLNISGNSIKEFVTLAVALEKAGFEYIQLNPSCPNNKKSKKIFALHPRLLYELVYEVRAKAQRVYLITKLSPKSQDIVICASNAYDGGTDAFSIANTYPGMSIDPNTLRPRIGGNTGGLSGPALRPINVLKVHEVFQAGLGIPIIGVGGITDADSTMEYILAGANAVEIGTASFKNPDVFKETSQGLKDYVKKHQVTNIQDLIGKVVLY